MNWCEIGNKKKGYEENPRHMSFYDWGYDECPICAKRILPSGEEHKEQITKLEQEFLREITYSDHSTDGNGFCMWLSSDDYPKEWLTRMRGVMTSLQKKGIIGVDNSMLYQEPRATWIWINGDYQERVSEEEYDALAEPFRLPPEELKCGGTIVGRKDWVALRQADYDTQTVVSTGHRLKNLEVAE
jgi:hypothetical protein